MFLNFFYQPSSLLETKFVSAAMDTRKDQSEKRKQQDKARKKQQRDALKELPVIKEQLKEARKQLASFWGFLGISEAERAEAKSILQASRYSDGEKKGTLMSRYHIENALKSYWEKKDEKGWVLKAFAELEEKRKRARRNLFQEAIQKRFLTSLNRNDSF